MGFAVDRADHAHPCLRAQLNSRKGSPYFDEISQKRHPRTVFVAIMGATTLSATILHIAEVGIWGFAYMSLGALQNYSTAMLYSLNAITSYGHTNTSLEDYWHLMGALEALNGWLLFGLSTAFLFGMIQKVWSVSSRTSALSTSARPGVVAGSRENRR